MPGIALINKALLEFEPKVVFAWHLSVLVELEDLIENGMPSEAERELVDPFGDELDGAIKADTDKPNALFLARITWNETRELIYRVYQPEPCDTYLRAIITGQTYPRDFDYRIDHDPDWALASWHLKAVEP